MNKIVISIIPHLAGGGMEKVTLSLSEGISKFPDCEVHIITIKPFEEQMPLPDNVHIHKLNTNIRNIFNVKISNQAKSKQITQYIKQHITSREPELIICHQESVSKIMQYSPFINTYHAVHGTLSHNKLGDAKGIARYFRKQKVKKVYQSLRTISVSKGVADDLKKTFSINNSQVIYNGIDQQQLQQLANEKVDLPAKPYFIHVGNFTAPKRHDRLIKAYLDTNIKDIDLVLLGGYSGITDEIKRMLLQYGADANRVHLLGFKSNPYPYIAGAKGFILSSDNEGLPTVLLEATALGIPTISTNCPSGPNEIFSPEYSHCLCDLSVASLSTKILEMYQSPESFCAPMQDKFTLEHMCLNYYNLIEPID